LDKKDWLFRQKSASGVKNIQTHPFLEISKTFSLPVHIKAEYHETNGGCCRYICTKFPKISNRKTKSWYFDCPQIIKSTWDQNFQMFMHKKEACALSNF